MIFENFVSFIKCFAHNFALDYPFFYNFIFSTFFSFANPSQAQPTMRHLYNCLKSTYFHNWQPNVTQLFRKIPKTRMSTFYQLTLNPFQPSQSIPFAVKSKLQAAVFLLWSYGFVNFFSDWLLWLCLIVERFVNQARLAS